MKKLIVMSLLLGSTVGVGGAIAHPTNVAYATRGECERAAAASAKQDRHEDWRCEYDKEEDAWFIVDHRFD